MDSHEAFFRCGNILLVPSERLLLQGGQVVEITGKAFDILVALIRHPGHLVSKDQLLAQVWPGLVVEEVNLSVNVSAIRKVLARSSNGAEWIETVPRQGYRFVGPVETGDIATLDLAQLRRGNDPHPTVPDRASSAVHFRRTGGWLLALAFIAVAALLAFQGYGTGPGGPDRKPTTNEAAYRAYLQGRFLWNERSEDGLKRSIDHFRQAIEFDADFALAHAALANAHTTLGYLSYVAPVNSFPVARLHALKALELDPSLAQAHASLAYVKFYFDWDWAGAREEFMRAIDLNPADPVSHQWYAVYLLAAGHPDHAFREIATAQRLDPLSLAVNTDIAFHHYYNGREAEAIAQLKSVLGMKSDFLLAHLWMARSLVEAGRYEEALVETASAERSAREWPVLVAARGYTYGLAGREGDARSVLLEMDALSRRRFVTAYGMALVHAGLGEKRQAFDWLDKAFEERSNWLVWLRLDPRWKTLREDDRFTAMIERLKFPP
ncbi:winged helix-turn-helix domain-containing protein [Variovorax sp. J31P207]|uniref:winged helix-turn-helix domain-containing protein n=1 Tax=Variovorax sp. J31P207 TaxID=3053510 RepID=UPI002578B825|nr:winged helix-turn-helix domain-containing protein [Variovorax sp. J31P207]MDM0070677.1 winged helix-turn-helix domain-containing protein [Variovorax sp. J31P207]